MSGHFQKQGRSLLANGYLIVPIRRGEKRPAIDGWQKSRLAMGDLSRYPDHGVGVLCGQDSHPIVGIDIDISHPVIGPAVIAWCQEHLGYGGERVGAAPRVLLAYRAAEAGWAKGNSILFFDPTDPVKPSGKENTQQVEILGLGQQFVAYHEHPDTGQDYVWTDLMGGIEHLHASDLPIVTEPQITALLVEVARLVRATPGVEVRSRGDASVRAMSSADDLLGLMPTVGMSLEEVRALLDHLKNDGDSYDFWLNVGMALHHEFAGTEHEQDALALWRDYGARSPKDDTSQYDYKWRSFGKSSGSEPTTLRWLLKVCYQAKKDQESTAIRENLEQIRSLIKGEKDNLALGGDTARKIRELMPDDRLVQTEALGLFQSQWKALTGTSMPVVQARSLIIGQRMPTVKAKRPLTEFGNAERMLDRYGDGLMYVPETKTWYLWTGVYWREAVDVEIEHLAKETIRALPREMDDHQDADAGEFFQFCAISQKAQMVRNMVSLAASDPRVAVPARELDRYSHLLGVQNGVVDLRTGQLLNPDPAYRITLACSCDYTPTAKCPLFMSTINDIFCGDTELVDYVLRTFGYTLLGNPTQDAMFIPFGNGANGKSTLFGVVRRALGTYARSAEASSFVSDGGPGSAGGPREDLVRLRGSRFVYVNEPDENSELREGTVKSMTGGDAITARAVYGKTSVEITPTWVIYMPTNHKPIIKGNDNGIWRRLRLIPFLRNFEADVNVVKDPHREEKLLAELPGILALIIRHAILYQTHGLLEPQAVRSARESYRTQMDLLAEWLEDCCDLGDDLVEESNRLWVSWEQFAKNRGILNYVKSSVALGRRLDSRFLAEKGPRGVRMRRGLRLKGSFEGESVAGVAGEGLFS